MTRAQQQYFYKLYGYPGRTLQRTRYLRSGLGSYDARPHCFYVVQLQLGDLMSRVGRIRMIRR